MKPYGDPNLGKYNLYPDINSPKYRRSSSNHKIDNRQQLNQILSLLNYSDGEHKLMDIVIKMNYPMNDYLAGIDTLKEAKLLEGPYFDRRRI